MPPKQKMSLEQKRQISQASKEFWADVKAGRKPMPKREGRKATPISIRFWDKVNKDGPICPALSTPCWIWTSNHGGTAYGMLSVPAGQEYMAHRISWEIHFGKIPDGMRVCHTCDVPKCVNPDHLWIGTDEDNRQDMLSKKRHAHGESSGISPFTNEQIDYIRVWYATGTVSQQTIANKYGVNQTAISAITRGDSWRHRL